MWLYVGPSRSQLFCSASLGKLKRDGKFPKIFFFPTSFSMEKPPNHISWRKRLYTTWLEYSTNHSFHLFSEKTTLLQNLPTEAILDHFAFKADNMESLEGYFQSGINSPNRNFILAANVKPRCETKYKNQITRL